MSIKLTDELEARLSAFLSQHGVSRSALVREAIAAHLDSRQSHTTAGSFASRAQDLKGCMHGPSDLSTNEAHLEGYGE